MNDMQALDRLIQLNRGGYEETLKWERSHRRHRILNRALLVFNVGLFINNVVYLIFNLSGWSIFLAFVAMGLLVFSVWLNQRWKEHYEWILESRRLWEADMRHWQAVKMEIEETDQVPEWAYQIPSRSMVDKS